MAEPKDRTAYYLLDSATLQTLKTEVLAEMSRQRLAGAGFGLPGGRRRDGVLYRDLMEELAVITSAIAYAGGSASGTVVQSTQADLG